MSEEGSEGPIRPLELSTSPAKSDPSKNKRRKISKEKVAVSAYQRILPTETKAGPSSRLGNILRKHRLQEEIPSVSIVPATIAFDNDDSEIRNDTDAERYRSEGTSIQIRRVESSPDIPDSPPATPRIPSNTTDPPPKLESRRKGVSYRGITRPVEVHENDWVKKSEHEKRRLWHVYRIASETYGKPAPQPCQQCLETGKNCRQYKDGITLSQLQCLYCTSRKKRCSFVQKALSAETQSNTNIRPSWDTVIWVTFRDNYPFHKSNTLAIQCFPDDNIILGKDIWLVEALETGLGDLAVKANRGGLYVHQGLATILAARALRTSFSIQLHDWTWLTGQLHGNDHLSAFSDSNGQPQNAVVFLHATTEQPSNMRQVFEYLRVLREIYDVKIRPYPSETEWGYDQRKMGDIRALDKIAQSTNQSGYSYRPRTCFGQTPCQLMDCEKTVHKRLHSEGGRHVKVLGKGICSTLTYASEEPQQGRAKQTPSVRPYWFHQEFVPNLLYGEFRLIIATKPDERGIRGRSGYIVALAWTSWTSSNPTTRELAVTTVDESDFGGSPSSKCGALSQSDLEGFCLYIFEKLRGQDSPCYESLEVGARMDVGVAEDRGQTFFFINEVTRWYNAHYFSHNLLSEPKTKICKAFAAAFVSYVHDAMNDVIH